MEEDRPGKRSVDVEPCPSTGRAERGDPGDARTREVERRRSALRRGVADASARRTRRDARVPGPLPRHRRRRLLVDARSDWATAEPVPPFRLPILATDALRR